jgi:hypothetical protein
MCIELLLLRTLLVFVLLYNAQGITPLGVLLYNEDEMKGVVLGIGE